MLKQVQHNAPDDNLKPETLNFKLFQSPAINSFNINVILGSAFMATS